MHTRTDAMPSADILRFSKRSNAGTQAENGPVAEGKVTSDITLSAGPPWNSIGVVMPDHSIQWSNGTHWRKQ
jgi:hypothetical protein